MSDEAPQHPARRENRRRPMIAFRAPNPAEYRRLVKAARAAGETRSEYVRRAVGERMDRTHSEVERQEN
jgi:hypothetical protein